MTLPAGIIASSLLVITLSASLPAQAPAGRPPATGQRRGGQNPDAADPIAKFDSVWIEELTWMEVRDAIKAGKTTAIIPAGSIEQNGPYVPTGKHVYVLRQTSEAIARKLGNALIAPTVPFEPGNYS